MFAIVLQIVYSLIHTAIVSSSTIFSSGSASFSWYTWVVALLWPVGGTVVCGALKALDVKEFERHMRWTRHHFGTRLGRYSPR